MGCVKVLRRGTTALHAKQICASAWYLDTPYMTAAKTQASIFRNSQSRKFRKRKLFVTTETLLTAMAAAAYIGGNKTCHRG